MGIAKHIFLIPMFVVTIIRCYLFDWRSGLPGVRVRQVLSWSLVLLYPTLYFPFLLLEPSHHITTTLFGGCPTEDDGEYTVVNFDGYVLRIPTNAISDCHSPYVGSRLDSEPHWIALDILSCNIEMGEIMSLDWRTDLESRCSGPYFNVLFEGRSHTARSNLDGSLPFDEYVHYDFHWRDVNRSEYLEKSTKNRIEKSVLYFQSTSISDNRVIITIILFLMIIGVYFDRKKLINIVSDLC